MCVVYLQAYVHVCMYVCMHEYRSAKIFQKSRNRLKIPGARRMTKSKFHSEEPQILGTTMQNLVTTVTWHPAIVHACMWIIYVKISCSWNKHITVLLLCGCESTVLCFFLLPQNCVVLFINSRALINYRMLHFPKLLCCGKISGLWRTLWILISIKYTY